MARRRTKEVKIRMNFTLSPEAANILQDMAEKLGRPMSGIVETSMLWVLLDNHFEEAHAWELKRAINRIEAVFAKEIAWQEELKRERGIPADRPLYPAYSARTRKKMGRSREGDEDFTDEEYERDKAQMEEDRRRGEALGRTPQRADGMVYGSFDPRDRAP